VLRVVLGMDAVDLAGAPAVAAPVMPQRPERKHGITRGLPAAEAPAAVAAPAASEAPTAAAGTVLIFDLETQRSAEEVGGWQHADRMGLALAVVYDVGRNVFRTYYEADVDRLLLDLALADRVVGFNIDRFDLAVLSASASASRSTISPRSTSARRRRGTACSRSAGGKRGEST